MPTFTYSTESPAGADAEQVPVAGQRGPADSTDEAEDAPATPRRSSVLQAVPALRPGSWWGRQGSNDRGESQD